MSRARAVQTSKDRLVANMLVTIPAVTILAMIWYFQQPKGSTVEGWGAPSLPL